MSVVYAGIECVLEKHRARHDIWNSVFGGAASGAIFGVLNNAKKSPMRTMHERRKTILVARSPSRPFTHTLSLSYRTAWLDSCSQGFCAGRR